MPRIIRKPQAITDLLQSVLFLELEASEKVANRFIDSTTRTFEQLLEMPHMGRLLETTEAEAKDVHVWRVRDFEKWLIFYHY